MRWILGACLACGLLAGCQAADKVLLPPANGGDSEAVKAVKAAKDLAPAPWGEIAAAVTSLVVLVYAGIRGKSHQDAQTESQAVIANLAAQVEPAQAAQALAAAKA
jgi:hypothetical protein